MIRTYKEERAGDVGTICEITGRGEEIYNDFRSLIDIIYENDEIAELFIDAWDKIKEQRGIK